MMIGNRLSGGTNLRDSIKVILLQIENGSPVETLFYVYSLVNYIHFLF